MTWTLQSRTDSPQNTRDLAAALAHVCWAGDILLLVGGLGAGKTTFAQGFARGLGVEGPVTSPTFTLVRQYPCHGPRGISQFLHADVYRLDTLSEVVDLSLSELVEEASVALVEWGDMAAPVLGDSALTVSLRPETTPSGSSESGSEAGAEIRTVIIRGDGPRWADREREVSLALDQVALA
jgi:tRNA threonylcarbamoyladenosine biosynthesis protein TsaE